MLGPADLMESKPERRTPWLSRAARMLALCAGVTVIACGDSYSNQTTNCATETRAEAYSAGMEKPGEAGAMTVRLLESVPGPPIKGNNTWRLRLVDQAGVPMTGASLKITPYMPDHKHGTSIKAVVQEQSGGEYTVSPLNLFMPGLWQVTVAAQPAGAPMDQAVFSVCISG